MARWPMVTHDGFSPLGVRSHHPPNLLAGMMLCAVTRGDARPHRVPKRLRKFIPPPFDFSNPSSLPEAMRKAIRKVHTDSFSLLTSSHPYLL